MQTAITLAKAAGENAAMLAPRGGGAFLKVPRRRATGHEACIDQTIL
jgi:hypothetical protein